MTKKLFPILAILASALGSVAHLRTYYPSINEPTKKRKLTDEDRRRITAAAEKRLRRQTNRLQSKAAQLKS